MDGSLLTLADFTTDLLDDEPRIEDQKLARALSFARGTDIHELIERHRVSLEAFGTLPYRTVNSGGRGRPGGEYRLNFNQAIFITIKSEAPNAVAVQIHVVTIYGLWARGKLQPIDAATKAQIATATTELHQRAPELAEALGELLKRVAELPTIGARVESVQRTALDIQDRLGDIVKRRPAPNRNQDIYDTVVIEYYLGRCPCCQRTNRIIIDTDGERTRDYCLDHATDNPYKNGLHEMWPVCGQCNHHFKRNPRYRAERMDAFRVFQHHVEDVAGRRLI